MIDFLLKTKPAIQPMSLETYVMWLQNKPSSWLATLSQDEKDQTLNAARKAAPNIRKVFADRKEKLVEKRKAQLAARQKKQQDKEQKVTSGKIDISRKIAEFGGPWLKSEVEEKLTEVDPDKQREAIHTQIKFHQVVLHSTGSKELFQKSYKGKTYSEQELKENLLKILDRNPTADNVTQDQDKLRYKTTSEVEEQHTTQKQLITSKLVEARRKRLANQQKDRLPELLDAPQSLVDKHILHCCKEDGIVQWFEAEVLSVYQIKNDPLKTEFTVRYKDTPDDEWHMPLLCDLKHGDLILQ